MRKKDLIEQNLKLFDALQKAKQELNELKRQLKAYGDEIVALKSELTVREEEPAEVTEPMHRLEEKVINNATLKPDMEYASKVIGDIVISAAEYSNRLSSGNDDRNKELINLIFGKTEVAKAEILTAVESDDTLEIKQAKIDLTAKLTLEYFESVIAQIM